MSDKGLDPEFLGDYSKEIDWAEAHGISQRTSKRYRDQGMPFLFFGGWIWIPKRQGREWIDGRVKRRNPRRSPRRQASQVEHRA
jgi:hypothetical protein